MRRFCPFGMIVGLLVFGAMPLLHGKEYYVAPGGLDSNSGLTWGTAFATISNAVAQGDATIVTVTNGTYNTTKETVVSGAITIRSFGGHVYGGLANASNTVVNGPGIGGYSGVRVLKITNPGAVLDGFTIRKGDGRDACHGSGINMTGCTVQNCIIKENGEMWGDASYLEGGGVNMTGGVLSNCIVQLNRTGQRGAGGGIYATGNGLIVDCQILNNTNNGGYNDGGGIYAQSTEVRNCLVANNGNLNGHGNPVGGGVYLDSGSMKSCTVANNSSQNGAGGVHIVNSGTVINSIIYSNFVSGVHNNLNTTTGVSYSCSTNSGNTSNGNITADPQFVSVVSNDYSIVSGSPCINAGNKTVVTWSMDVIGNRRIAGGGLDMGALEFPFPAGTLFLIR